MSQTRTSNLFIGEAIPHIWLRVEGNSRSLISLGVCWVTKEELFHFQRNSIATPQTIHYKYSNKQIQFKCHHAFLVVC